MRFALVILAVLAAAPATAQYPEARGTPRAKTQGVELGVWAVYSQVGFTLIAAEKREDGNWYAIATTDPYLTLADFETAIKAAGSTEAWIDRQLPKLNDALAKRFAMTTAASGGDKLPLLDQVNATLMASYRIVVGADGVPRLVRK
jgi:hypothetical protein